MKKIVSITISLLLFVNILILILTFTEYSYLTNNKIKKTIYSYDYTNLVNLKTKDKNNYLVKSYTNIYKKLIKQNYKEEEINKILNKKEMKESIYEITIDNINYILTGHKEQKDYDKKIKKLNINNKEVDISKYISMNKLNDKINNKIERIPLNIRKIINIINTTTFKIILASSLIILTLLLFIFSKEKVLTYIFTITTIIGIIILLLTVTTEMLIENLLYNYSFYYITNKIINEIIKNMAVISILIIILSIIFIIISEHIINKNKKVLRPRIQVKKEEYFF